MEFRLQPDLMLYKFVCNTVIAHGRENLTNFRLGVELVRDAVCFFGKIYYWLMMLSEDRIVP